MMSGHMPGDQMRSARADAKPCSAFGRCRYEARIRGEPQIIIAAECDYLAAVDHDMCVLRTGNNTTPPLQPLTFEGDQVSAQVGGQHNGSKVPGAAVAK